MSRTSERRRAVLTAEEFTGRTILQTEVTGRAILGFGFPCARRADATGDRSDNAAVAVAVRAGSAADTVITITGFAFAVDAAFVVLRDRTVAVKQAHRSWPFNH